MIMALSDGAGSAAFALEAAQITVKSILYFFTCTMTPGHFLLLDESVQRKRIISTVREALRKHSAFRETNAGEFSATLCFAVADSRCILCGNLGDGAVYAVSSSGDAAFEMQPERRGKNSTYFTVSPDAESHLRMEKRSLRDISGVLLTSDGPYQMFRNRGEGAASATAHELLTFARQGNLSTQRTLARVLNQMAEYPAERLDDWAAMLYTRDQKISPANPPQIVSPPVISMLSEENQKYFPRKSNRRFPRKSNQRFPRKSNRKFPHQNNPIFPRKSNPKFPRRSRKNNQRFPRRSRRKFPRRFRRNNRILSRGN